jgi:hypothetical protein
MRLRMITIDYIPLFQLASRHIPKYAYSYYGIRIVGMGWQEGVGLGADGEGIVNPILEKSHQGKTGVGSDIDPETIAGDFANYRKQLSSEYRTKIIERENKRDLA